MTPAEVLDSLTPEDRAWATSIPVPPATIVCLSQLEYERLEPKDPGTLYVVHDDEW